MLVIKQSDVFLQGEGDAWYERNKDKPRLPDPVIEAMRACNLQPTGVFEAGCGDGSRLAEICKIWDYLEIAYGCDTSEVATIKERVFDPLRYADVLDTLKMLPEGYYDTIIFGFCLYLVDREDLMLIAAHTDRVLKDGGHIIIHDFAPSKPYRCAYKHKEGVWSYHMDYARLWLANPAYKPIENFAYLHREGEDYVYVLKKDMANAYPERKI